MAKKRSKRREWTRDDVREPVRLQQVRALIAGGLPPAGHADPAATGEADGAFGCSIRAAEHLLTRHSL